MARIRSVKPEFWTDGDVMDLPPQARELFMGSWNFAMCDYGHLADDARRLKMQVLPADDTMMVRDEHGAWVLRPFDAHVLLDLIIASGRIRRLELDGDTYLHILRFTRHQRLEKRWTPRCPACKALGGPPKTTENLAEPHETSREVSQTRRTSAPDRTGQDRTSAAAAADDAAAAADLPGPIEILRQRLQAHTPLRGLRFDTLTADQTSRLLRLVDVHGDAPLVRAAIDTCRNPAPSFVTAFLGTWEALPPPGKRLAVVRPTFCTVHPYVQLTSNGVCTSCAADQREATR